MEYIDIFLTLLLSCYFKSWKMMLWKCCNQYASKFGKLAVATGLGKVSFHSNPKERQCQRMLKIRSVAQSCLTLCDPMNHSMNQSVVSCPVLTVASWHTYKFLKRQVSCSGIPISFRIFHSLLWSTVKGFGIVNKAEIDVFLELSCFFHDPADVGNLISGSSAFSKTSLNIRKFTVRILLKPGLENLEHY